MAFYPFEIPFSLIVMFSVLAIGFCLIVGLRYLQLSKRNDYQLLQQDILGQGISYEQSMNNLEDSIRSQSAKHRTNRSQGNRSDPSPHYEMSSNNYYQQQQQQQ